MSIGLIVTLALLGLFGAYMIYSFRRMKNMAAVPESEKILTLTDKNFQHQIRNRVVLVDFWAGWCVPCRMMAPVLNEIAGELSGNACVGKVDVEKYQGLAQRFRVRNIPTMVLFRNGKEVDRFVGVKTKEFLMSRISKAS